MRPFTVRVTALLILLGAGAARAQSVQSNLWVPDGTVDAVATAGGVAYIGGSFTRVGPPIGGFTALDETSSGVLAPNPGVTGSVLAVIPDGSGGCFIAGSFGQVQGQARVNLARLDASGQVTTWSASAINGPVRALAIDSANPGVLYAGGEFSDVGGQPRGSLAAFDVGTGALTGWTASTQGVKSLVARNGMIYVAGDFLSVGGQTRHRLAAIDASGSVLGWNPDANDSVEVMVPFVSPIAGNPLTLYVGGKFTSMGGQARYAIAALDAATGAPTSWSPNGDHVVKSITIDIGNRGFINSIYVGGTFDVIGGVPRSFLAQLDPGTGVAKAWNPGADGPVSTILLAASGVIVGGEFLHAGGAARDDLAALDYGTGAATAWNPDPNGPVRCLAFGGGGIDAGGEFTSFGGVVRNHVAALDLATGQATPWNPGADGAIFTLLMSRDTLYAGGQFQSFGGLTRHHAAAVTTGGVVTPWDPDMDGTVYTIVRDDTMIYLGGSFATARGGSAPFVTRVDPYVGVVRGSFPFFNGTVHALALDSPWLYVGGEFTSADFSDRPGIARVHKAVPFLSSWKPNLFGGFLGTTTYSIAIRPNSVLLGGDFSTGHGSARGLDEFTKLDATEIPWDLSLDGLAISILPVGQDVFVTGQFGHIGSATTGALIAVNTTTHQQVSWNPGLTSTGLAMAWAGDRLLAGGTFPSAGGQAHARFAAFLGPVTAVDPGRTTSSRVTVSRNPSWGAVWIGFDAPRAGPIEVAIYDATGRRVRRVSNAFVSPGAQRVRWDGNDDGGRPVCAGVYWARVRSDAGGGVTRLVRLR